MRIGIVSMSIQIRIRISTLMPIADPGLDPDWHLNSADSHAYPTLSFTHVRKTFFLNYLFCFELILIRTGRIRIRQNVADPDPQQ